MSKRKKGRSQRSTDSLQSSISRDLDRGNAKEAVKNARVAFRREPSDGNRLLLQRACLARAEQLHQKGLSDQARDLLREIGGLGVLADDLRPRLNRLRVLLGAAAPAGGEAADEPAAIDPGLRAELADQAVLQGSGTALPSDLREQVDQVLTVLRLIETDEAGAEDLVLQAIDRKSPLADWKLFARGLEAYYADDDERALANWRRLDADRPPRRIAEALMLAGGLTRDKDASPETRSRARRLTAALDDSSLVGDLRKFRRHWDDAEWGPLLRSYSRIAARYGESHADIVNKLGELLSGRILKEERHGEMRRLPKSYTGPPMDPKFNRVKALLAEVDDEWLDARRAWLAYVDDLQQNPVLPDRDRSIAMGKVYQRVADNTAHLAEECTIDYSHPWGETDERVQRELQGEACAFFERSLEHAPALQETYIHYAETLKQFGEHPKKVERVYKRLIEQHPEDVDALLVVAQHFLDQEEPGVAKKYVRAAERHQPRHERVKAMLWVTSVSAARVAAQRKEFGVARGELDEAEPLCAPGRDRYVLDAYRAAIEFKAGNRDRAEEFLQTAVRHFDQPAVGLLIVSAQAFRVGVSRDVRNDLNGRVKKELAATKKTSRSAGAMAHFFSALERTDTTYHGVRTHCRMVTKYLKACKRVRWEVADLISVCEFLSNEEDRTDAYVRLANKGLRQFPQEPYFHFAAGQIEMMEGPVRCNRLKARIEFERAIELSKTADRPLDELQRASASRALHLLDGPPPLTPGFDFFEDEDDDDELFLDGGPTQAELEEVIDSLPANARRELEMLERETGLDVLDMVRRALASEMAAHRDEADDESPNGRRARARAKWRKVNK